MEQIAASIDQKSEGEIPLTMAETMFISAMLIEMSYDEDGDYIGVGTGNIRGNALARYLLSLNFPRITKVINEMWDGKVKRAGWYPENMYRANFDEYYKLLCARLRAVVLRTIEEHPEFNEIEVPDYSLSKYRKWRDFFFNPFPLDRDDEEEDEDIEWDDIDFDNDDANVDDTPSKLEYSFAKIADADSLTDVVYTGSFTVSFIITPDPHEGTSKETLDKMLRAFHKEVTEMLPKVDPEHGYVLNLHTLGIALYTEADIEGRVENWIPYKDLKNVYTLKGMTEFN